MKKYLYKNIKTGERVQSNKQLNNPDLKLIAAIRDGKINKNKVYKK